MKICTISKSSLKRLSLFNAFATLSCLYVCSIRRKPFSTPARNHPVVRNMPGYKSQFKEQRLIFQSMDVVIGMRINFLQCLCVLLFKAGHVSPRSPGHAKHQMHRCPIDHLARKHPQQSWVPPLSLSRHHPRFLPPL